MFLDEPYFMTNDDWYYFDTDEKIYKIKESAPMSAKESYKEYYEKLSGTQVNNNQ